MEAYWGNKTTPQSTKIKTIFEECPQIYLLQDQWKFCEERYYQGAEAATKQIRLWNPIIWQHLIGEWQSCKFLGPKSCRALQIANISNCNQKPAGNQSQDFAYNCSGM